MPTMYFPSYLSYMALAIIPKLVNKEIDVASINKCLLLSAAIKDSHNNGSFPLYTASRLGSSHYWTNQIQCQ